MDNRLFTSESVTEGHPDKMCDQISDAVSGCTYMQQDPMSRVACETCNHIQVLLWLWVRLQQRHM